MIVRLNAAVEGDYVHPQMPHLKNDSPLKITALALG